MEDKILKTLFILLGSLVLSQIIPRLIALPLRNLPSRHRTILGFTKQIVTVLIYFLGGLAILSLFGIDMMPYLLSSSIIGFAIAFGSQSFFKDVIAGINLLFESHVKIGKIIKIGDYTGELKRITLKSTYLESSNGDLYIIPNGEIKILIVKHTDKETKSIK